LVASTVLMAQLGGCAGSSNSGSGSNDAPFNQMITRRTEYYLNGPQQSAPADGRFDEGTRVRLLEPAGEYVKVQTPAGITAFVSLSDIGPIPPDQK
jgi:hypothetical protein